MPPPKLVPPKHLTGIDAARWHRNHNRLIGGAVINAAYHGVTKKQRSRLQRLRGNNRAEEEDDRARLTVLEKSSGTLIAAEKSWSAPTNVPAVCSVGNLNLSKTSSPKEIQ